MVMEEVREVGKKKYGKQYLSTNFFFIAGLLVSRMVVGKCYFV